MKYKDFKLRMKVVTKYGTKALVIGHGLDFIGRKCVQLAPLSSGDSLTRNSHLGGSRHYYAFGTLKPLYDEADKEKDVSAS